MHVFGHPYWPIHGIGRDKIGSLIFSMQSFDRKLAIEDSNNDSVMRGIDRSIHDQDITVIYASILHGCTTDFDIKSGFGMLYHKLV
jgi:hypothetical protein